MRKILALLFTLIMILTIPITGLAANTKITVSGATARRGEMVYLDVSLSDCKKANTLGITMEYDSSVLKKVASDCTWENKGTVQDFDVAKDNGVWGIKTAKDLNGKICTLAFRVKANAPIGDTDVTCKVIVKSNSKEIGTYTAKATVSVTCDHSYGEWSKKDAEVHKKICKYCEFEKTASHDWEKTAEKDEFDVYTCKICGESKEVKKQESSGETPDNSNGSDLNQENTNITKPDNWNQEDNNSVQEDGSNQGNDNLVQSDDSSQQNDNSSQTDNSEKKDENTKKPEDSKEKNDNEITHGGNDSSTTDDTGRETGNVSEKIETEEHVHTDECVHTQSENNTDFYLWMAVLVIVVGVSVFGFIKLRTKKK